MYQKIIIVGNLGGDPEMKYTPKGDAVTSFSVATNERWTGADGQSVEEVTWFRVSVWGKSAEACNQYLAKGRQVLVEGKLSVDKVSGGPRIWKDSAGEPRASYEIRAFKVQFLGGGQQVEPQGAGSPSVQDQGGGPPDSVDTDEIPF